MKKGSNKKSGQQKLNELQEESHNKARNQATQSQKKKKQVDVVFSDLVKRFQTPYPIIQPQHIPHIQFVTVNPGTNITLHKNIDNLNIILNFNEKQCIDNFKQDQNENIQQMNFDFSIFPNLRSIRFNNGKISNINNLIVEKTKLLEIDFSGNQISNINKLPRFPFKLRILSLENNKITSLQFLKSSDLRNLTILYLQKNLISSLEPLVNADLKYLIQLHLSENLITTLDHIGQINFKHLKKLALDKNKITSISEIYKIDISSFNWIQLSSNQISDFTPILKMQVKDVAYIYNVEIEDYFPGIYIYENKVQDDYLTKIFENNEKLKCIVGEIEEQQWEVLYQKYGRYDNYGQYENKIKKLIKQNEVNSVQGQSQEEIQQAGEEGQGQGEEGSQNQQ